MNTNTHIDCDIIPLLLKDEYVTAYITRSGNKMYCNIITAFVQTNWGIPLNQFLFVCIRTEHNCLRVHEKSISLNLGEKQSIRGADTNSHE